MRTVIAAALIAASVVAAKADEVSIKLGDAAQSAVGQLPAILDQCVSGVMVRGDAAQCKVLSGFLTGLGNEVKVSQAAAKKAAEEKKPEETPAQ